VEVKLLNKSKAGNMKVKLNFSRPILNLFIAVLFFMAGPALTARENNTPNLKAFKIVVEKTGTGIKMKSLEGSAWLDLLFSLNNYRPQAIDEYGMTALNAVSSNKDAGLADFLFTVTKTENGIELKGIEGTAWTELSFSLAENEKQAIDQNGLITRY